MPGIDSIITMFDKFDGVNLVTHPERCLRVRNRTSKCNKCSDACTSGAINTDNNQLIVDTNLCIGCGTCASVCPTAAIEAINPTDNELLNISANIIREQEKQSLFACGQLLKKHQDSYDKEQIIPIVCLGRLEESELIALNILGATDIRLFHDNCSECPNKIGRQTIELINSNTTTMLNAWDLTNAVSLHQGLPQKYILQKRAAKTLDSAVGVSRRDFFAQLKTEVQTMAADVAVDVTSVTSNNPSKIDINKVMMRGELSHFTPARHQRLLDSFALLQELGDFQSPTLDTSLFGRVEIAVDKCNSCMMCARFCPTGALSKFDSSDGDDAIILVHYPAYCVQCGLCQETCRQDAIQVFSTVSLQEILEDRIIQHKLAPEVPIYVEGENELPVFTAMRNLLGDVNIYEHG